jgi:hypothetical protein
MKITLNLVKFWTLNRAYTTGIIDTQILKLNTEAELLTWQMYNKAYLY